MGLNRLWRWVFAVPVVVAAAVTLVSVAGASQLRASATTASPETTIIDPLSRRGEERPQAAASRSSTARARSTTA